MLKRRLTDLLFFIAVVFLSLLYSYHRELFRHPHAIHTWRQCDGAQIALNYYEQSMNFFEPRLSICLGNEGKMGSEFPIIYYSAACLYKIFGFHEFFIRLISLCFFYAGLFYLYKTITLFLNDRFYGILLALLFFTSPLIIDYANNFLPDVPAISLAFIACYYFLVFQKIGKSNALWKATFFFSFAGLLKITALTGYLAIIGVILLRVLFSMGRGKISGIIVPRKALIGFFILPGLISGLWVIYIKHYNLVNDNTYFLTKTVPYWNMPPEGISEVWDWLSHRWMHAIMHRWVLYSIPFLSLLCGLILARKAIPLAVWLAIFITECIAYFILFFAQFRVHDYYLIPFVIIPIALGVVLLLEIKNKNESLFNSVFLRGAVFIFFSLMVVYGRRVNAKRDYHDGWSYCQAFYDIEPELQKHGIERKDKVISIGDGSSGISLYFMNRRGWTSMTMTHPAATEKDIEDCISKGAKFLALDIQQEDHISAEAKDKYLVDELFMINGIKFFRL